jgi:hypothetical protein
MSAANQTPGPQTLHPYCRTCGWRKGGLDSWDGKACKCGHREQPIETRLPAPEKLQ